MAKKPTAAPTSSERVAEINAIALAEILADRGGFNVWRYFGELKALRPARPTPDWLEAVIMVGVIGRIRPAQTMTYLKALRDLREAAGQAAAFALFKDRIDAYLAPLIHTNHGYKNGTFSTLDHAAIWTHLGGLIERLRGDGHEVFLNSGTLLGVVRDGRLIEHDDDLDLAVVLPGGSEAEAAAAWTALVAELGRLDVLDPERQKHAAILKLHPAEATEIDLFPAWVAEDRVYVYPHTCGELARDEVLPTKPCPVTGYPIPAEPEKMLALNYGEGWREPDPFFKFPWTAAYKKFATFLDRL